MRANVICMHYTCTICPVQTRVVRVCARACRLLIALLASFECPPSLLPFDVLPQKERGFGIRFAPYMFRVCLVCVHACIQRDLRMIGGRGRGPQELG